MKKNKKTSEKTVNTAGLISNRKISSCMTHRSDIIWIDSMASPEEVIAVFDSHPRFSFFPVCSQTIDTVRGCIKARSFLSAYIKNPQVSLTDLLTAPVFIPETVSIEKAITFLGGQKTGIALIIDEYGGIEGLVTKDSLISELFDELSLAAGNVPKDMLVHTDGSRHISGSISISELAYLGIAVPSSEEYTTLAGYILTLTNALPQEQETIRDGTYQYVIEQLVGKRIEKVHITALQ